MQKVNGKFSIITDIAKTFVKGHRIPIDNELADIVAVLIANSKIKVQKITTLIIIFLLFIKEKEKECPLHSIWSEHT